MLGVSKYQRSYWWTVLTNAFPYTAPLYAASIKPCWELHWEGFTILRNALCSTTWLSCVLSLSLEQLMALLKKNVPRRKRTEIKWVASLSSHIWLVAMSRHLTLWGALLLTFLSIWASTAKYSKVFLLEDFFVVNEKTMYLKNKGLMRAISWLILCVFRFENRFSCLHLIIVAIF